MCTKKRFFKSTVMSRSRTKRGLQTHQHHTPKIKPSAKSHFSVFQHIFTRVMFKFFSTNLDRSLVDLKNLLLQNLLFPPVPIRPSVAMDLGAGSNEDDLTVKLQEIIDVNVALELALMKDLHTRTVMEKWDFLQMRFVLLENLRNHLPLETEKRLERFALEILWKDIWKMEMWSFLIVNLPSVNSP
jgi:RNA polymerase Rpb1, domain 1